MSRFLTLFVFIFTSYFIFSQNTISGRVIQSTDNSALEFVNVVAFKAVDSSMVLGVLSDSTGYFNLSHLPNGKYYVLFKSIGFSDTIVSSITLSSKNNAIDLGTVVLQFSNSLNEVVVKSEEKLIENKVDKRIYNVEKDLTSKGASLTDVLNNVPSVEVDQDGNISLRGNSSVNILIDGRQSVSTKSSLETIPASSVERIEIINNPSAKYNPEGMGGIINIVLKKDKLRGVNGNVNLSYATGNLFNGSASINARNKWINFFASYGYRSSNGLSAAKRLRTSDDEEKEMLLNQTRSGNRIRLGHTAKIGADFNLKNNHLLGFSLSGMVGDRIGDELLMNSFYKNNAVSSYFERSNDENDRSKNLDANLNYTWTFKKEKGNLVFDFTESYGNRNELGVFRQTYFDQNYIATNVPLLLQNQINPSNFSIFSGRIDLTRHFLHSITLETGGKVMLDDDASIQYRETYNDSAQAYLPDVSINNNFKVKRNTYAVYGIFSHKVKKFSYQLGLRLEQTNMHSVLVTTNQSFTNNYLSLFPSAHLSYELPQKGSLNLSYSRRIDRPSNGNLNPFPSYSDPYNLRQGNPFLRPEYINSFEFAYNKDWKKLSLILNAYFKQSFNSIQQVVNYLPNNVAVSSYTNIHQKLNYGLEAIVTYAPFDWWRNTFSSNFFRTSFADSVASSNNAGLSGSLKLMSSFLFWKKTTTLQLNAHYALPMISPQGKMQPTPSIDLSLQRSFLKGNLSIELRVTDVFNTRGFKLDLISDGVRQQSSFKWQTRRIYFTLNYRLGKMMEGKKNKNHELPSSGGDDMGF
jgi:outer membrane receptor protein involved in Fe transport